MSEFKIGSPISMDRNTNMNSVAIHRLIIPYGTTPFTFQYAGDGSKVAKGKTDAELSADEATAGLKAVPIQPLTQGEIIYLEASEAIAIHEPFISAANGKIKNITTNATPQTQFAYGIVMKAALADEDVVPCWIDSGDKYVK